MSGSLPRIDTQHVQGRDVAYDSSDDHFSSASEGTPDPIGRSAEAPHSPIPITRVERVDDKAAHGEVPGTPAYDLRAKDAVPDEVEIVPEGRRSRSATTSRSRSHSHLSETSGPATPGGTAIPRTVVERVDDKPAHGEVEGTPAFEMRTADAQPDEIRQAPAVARQTDDGPWQVENDSDDRQAWFRSMWEGKSENAPFAEQTEVHDATNQADQVDRDDFGDEFDDFAQGAEGEDDFGDFDDAEPASTPAHVPEAQQIQPASIPSALAGLPPLDLKLDLSQAELDDIINPYLDIIFPSQHSEQSPLSSLPPLDASNSSPFLSDRSLSLWQQLVSPPPMQPPNWTRSRIRRLFLVSLGVPVDLDEILPPSKQKRLVLPNINLTSPRASAAQLDRIKQGGTNDSTTSLDSKTGEPKKRASHKKTGTIKGPPPAPSFDSNQAALVCRTTDEALLGMADEELRAHVTSLESLNREASLVLEYWLQRKDEALKEKEALEGVVGNLVGFVKGRRGGK